MIKVGTADSAAVTLICTLNGQWSQKKFFFGVKSNLKGNLSMLKIMFIHEDNVFEVMSHCNWGKKGKSQNWRQIYLCDLLGWCFFLEPEMFKVISPNRGDAVSHRTFYRSSPFCPPLLFWIGAGIIGIHLGYWFRQEPISTIFSWGFSCLQVIHKPKLSLTVSSNKFCVYVVYGTIPVWYAVWYDMQKIRFDNWTCVSMKVFTSD